MGLGVLVAGYALIPAAVGFMEATGQVYREAVVYMRSRLWGAPAVVVSLAALLFQPINAFAFATDGIHWGTGDFRYLRNAMLGASAAAPWPLKSVLGMTGDRPAGVIFSPGTGGSTSIKIHDRQSFTGRKTP